MQAFIFFSCLGGLISFVWLLSLISNDIDEQFSRATNRQQSDQDRQPSRPFFHWVMKRLIGLYGEPDRSISDENEQDQKRKLDADMVLWTRAVARYTKALVLVSVIGAVIAFGTLLAIKGQLDEMQRAYGPLKDSADAAKVAANAASTANTTTRNQINASLIVPDEPESTIRIGQNGAVSVDLYLANTGQTWARDVYANIEVIIKTGQRRIYFAPAVWFGGFDISQTTPWHHTITDFQPLFTGQIKNDDLLTIEITIGISYSDIFDEKTSRYFRMKGWGDGDVNSRCCTLKEFQDGLGFQRQAEMSNVPPIPPK